jgi:hypothetical protein
MGCKYFHEIQFAALRTTVKGINTTPCTKPGCADLPLLGPGR